MRPGRARRYPVAAAVLLLLLATSGCDGRQPPADDGGTGLRAAIGDCTGNAPASTQPPTTPAGAQPPIDAGPDEIVIATDADTSVSQRRRKLIDEWNQTHDTKARLVELRESTDLVHADVAAAMQNGSPRYDVMLLDIPWIAEFAEEGYIRPLDGRGFDRGDFFAGPWQAGCYRGHLYAVPFTTDVGLLYCRSDLGMREPTSWVQLAAGLPPPSSNPTVKLTLATQLANYEGLTVNALEAIWSAGGHFVDKDALLDQKAREGLTNMVRAVVAGDGTVGSTDFREAGTLNAFQSGKAACMRNWPYAKDLIPTTGAHAIPFEVHPLRWQSVLGGWSLVLSASSPRPRQAVELIKFLTNHDNEKEVFVADGLLAARRDVYSDAEVLKNAFAAELSQAIDRARPRPTTPHYPEVSRALRETMSGLLRADEFDPTAVDAQLDRLEVRLHGALAGR